MNKEKIKNIIILVLLGVVILLTGIILGTHLNKGTKINTPEEVTTEKEKELTTEEVLASLEGEWGMCRGEYDCEGIIIGKDGDNYYYTPYIMWSEFGGKGTIEKVEKVEDGKYTLTIHHEAYEDDFGSSPEYTINQTINVSEIDDKIIYVGTVKFQKFEGDRETFFQSIMS